MLESVISGIAVPIFEQFWKAGGKIAGQAGQAQKDVRKVENILQASREYHQKYESRHGQMKIMPGLMKAPIPLDSIYTAVKFLDDRSIRYFATPDDLEQSYRDQGKRSFQNTAKRHDGITVAKEKEYLMVLGGPGIGKSTFLKKLGLEALKGQEGQLQSEQIPVFLELKTFRDENIDLVAKIAQEFEICGFPDTETFTVESLNQGKLLLLLDGLDEVPTRNMNRVIEQIEAFATRYDKNTFVTSCRTAAYHSSFRQFSDVTIADFDDEQIEQFIQQWFNSKLDQEADTAHQYWQLLQRPQSKAAKELAQTPLLLTFLCLVYEREQTLPSKRSILYGQALNILLSEWSAQKRLEHAPIYEDFHPELEKELLSEIAHNSFKEDRLFFSKSDITDRITNYLADTLDAPENLDGPAVLYAIEVQQGILVERATDTYSFSHLTLQEYLAARYINSQWLIEELVTQYLTDERWREVFLLVSGLAGGRNHEFLLAMERQANVLIKKPKLQDLLQWAMNRSDKSHFSYQILALRILFLISAIDIAKAIARDLDLDLDNNILQTRSRAVAIAKIIISDSNISIDNDILRDSISYKLIDSGILIDSKNFIDFSNRVEIVSALARARDIEIAKVIARDINIAKDINIANSLSKAIEMALNFVKQSFISVASVINIDRLISIDNNINYDDVLSNTLEYLRTKTPSEQATVYEWKVFVDQLIKTFLTFFHLDRELVTFSLEEAKALEKYFYAVKLIIDCKNAAVRVSRKEWEAIKVRLLTPQPVHLEDDQPS